MGMMGSLAMHANKDISKETPNSPNCILQEATKKVVTDFTDRLTGEKDNKRLPFIADSLDVEIRFAGADVLGAFADMESSGKSSN